MESFRHSSSDPPRTYQTNYLRRQQEDGKKIKAVDNYVPAGHSSWSETGKEELQIPMFILKVIPSLTSLRLHGLVEIFILDEDFT